ncbi:MAG: hypothetical protein ACD_21C00132G0001, partial [uncultured bacterium]
SVTPIDLLRLWRIFLYLWVMNWALARAHVVFNPTYLKSFEVDVEINKT